MGRGSSEYVVALKNVNPYRISLYLHCNYGAEVIYGSGEDRPDYVGYKLEIEGGRVRYRVVG